MKAKNPEWRKDGVPSPDWSVGESESVSVALRNGRGMTAACEADADRRHESHARIPSPPRHRPGESRARDALAALDGLGL